MELIAKDLIPTNNKIINKRGIFMPDDNEEKHHQRDSIPLKYGYDPKNQQMPDKPSKIPQNDQSGNKK
jgi:hypothetical protein